MHPPRLNRHTCPLVLTLENFVASYVSCAASLGNGRIPGILDGGPTGVGLESTVVLVCSESSQIVILRPGGVTSEMLSEVIGKDNVSIDRGTLSKTGFH